MAPPRKEIDPAKVELLAGCGCTVEEIAAKLDCSKDTLERRYAAHIIKGRDVGRSSIRGKQFERAMKGSDTMLIWLGKQTLGQRDKSDISITTISDEELEAEVKRRILLASGGVASGKAE